MFFSTLKWWFRHYFLICTPDKKGMWLCGYGESTRGHAFKRVPPFFPKKHGHRHRRVWTIHLLVLDVLGYGEGEEMDFWNGMVMKTWTGSKTLHQPFPRGEEKNTQNMNEMVGKKKVLKRWRSRNRRRWVQRRRKYRREKERRNTKPEKEKETKEVGKDRRKRVVCVVFWWW